VVRIEINSREVGKSMLKDSVHVIIHVTLTVTLLTIADASIVLAKSAGLTENGSSASKPGDSATGALTPTPTEHNNAWSTSIGSVMAR
jgi:hypothetical protein